MRINRQPLKVRQTKPPFFIWLLGSPKAFSITWRMAMIIPVVLFGLLSLLAVIYKQYGLAIVPTLLFGLAIYNLYHNRGWFKVETDTTIGEMVWGLQVKK